MASEVGPVTVGLCPSAHDRDAQGRMPRYGFALEHRLFRCPKGGFPEVAAGQQGKKQQILQLFSLAFHPSVAPLETQDAMTTQKPTWHFWHLPDGEGHLPGKVTTPRTRSCK